MYTLLFDGTIQPRSFEVFQKRLFDCSCTEDKDLAEIVLDYSGTKWELGLHFLQKNLPFVLNSNLRNFKKQGYAVAFFDFDSSNSMIQGLEKFYKTVILPYPEIYFAVCIKQITKDYMYVYKEFFQKNLFNYNEINIVANVDNVCGSYLDNLGQNEDEAELIEKSSCYAFDKQDNLLESFTNAFDVRQYCANEFNSGFIRKIKSKDISFNPFTNNKTFNYLGRSGVFLQRVSFPKSKNYPVLFFLNSDTSNPPFEVMQQIVEFQEKYNYFYPILCFSGLNEVSWKDYIKTCAVNQANSDEAKDYYKNLQKMNVVMNQKLNIV